ncbi:MAG: hypothetical protein JNK58_10690 [Phycisphaerae bacterium]|nr:hypothetical protein [Phycisphaerae bacterium]
MLRAVIGGVVYLALTAAYPLIESPFARAVARISDVLLFRPGFRVESHFATNAGARGEELAVEVRHPPSGLVATNRLDLRFRLWVPAALFTAMVVVTPERPRRKVRALGIGVVSLAALALLSSWLVAMYPVILAPENMLGLGTGPRVAFNVVYSVVILSNPTAALFPVVLWGATMSGLLGILLSGRGTSQPGPAGAGPPEPGVSDRR